MVAWVDGLESETSLENDVAAEETGNARHLYSAPLKEIDVGNTDEAEGNRAFENTIASIVEQAGSASIVGAAANKNNVAEAGNAGCVDGETETVGKANEVDDCRGIASGDGSGAVSLNPSTELTGPRAQVQQRRKGYEDTGVRVSPMLLATR